MNASNSYQDWYQSMSQIGFKHMEYFSVFYNRAFEWQTHFYKVQVRAAERIGELSREANANGSRSLTLPDMFLGFQAFQQKELLALYQSRQFKQTSQELKEVLPVITKLHKEYFENLLMPFPVRAMLHLKYPYFVSDKNLQSVNSGLEPDVPIKTPITEKKKRRE